MTRTPRPIISEGIYFITAVTYERHLLFARHDLAQIVIDQWKHYAGVYEFKLDAYSVLPDHCHVVLQVGHHKTISQILHAVHSYTSTLINQSLDNPIKERIWQGSAWDEVIRDEEMYWQKIAYTLLNPWRAGIVSDPMDTYAFSNITEWIQREGGDFVNELFSKYKRGHE